ncbi:BON domain-containing protein [Neorhodopirellula lusitana]|uniref:BON domain-containing protein n=2 Tax=Neorhodopirellula lusitana TaxID=445327 RepID=A0ABY1Q700_9BACT|nr:BON domain-containing protein [Neorhodopirellula lusitana]
MVATLLRPMRQSNPRLSNGWDPIQTRVQEVLDAASYTELQQISCERRRGIVFLSGDVSSEFMKQLAQESIRDVEGVSHLVNAIQVVDHV